ncbi:nuclear transport factor 2 family protein [Sorangium sp. So ce1078]|uniref:nuclear transport factor 2 family protein n=1 Tax=Sorangium sp. So ce1078 TaxID=3133329 RepID=UPI003F5D5693
MTERPLEARSRRRTLRVTPRRRRCRSTSILPVNGYQRKLLEAADDNGKIFTPSMRATFIPLVLAGGLSACQPNRTDSPEKLRSVIVSYFDCVSRKDFERMKTLTTPDFLIFENGKVIDNDGLIDIIKGSPITKATYSFDDVRINVDSNSGSMIYVNHGEFVKDDASTITRDWLESAIFKKVGNEWRLYLVHSTVKK